MVGLGTRPGVRPRRSRPILLLLLGSSCLQPAGGTPPGLDDAQTILVLNLSEATEGRPNSSLVVEGAFSHLTTTAPAETHLLAYPMLPSQLGLRPGRLSLRPGGPDTCGPQFRPLPIPEQVWRLDEVAGWSKVPDEPRLAQLCVPEPRMVECLSGGGCYRVLPYPGPLFCDLSCPPPPAPTHPTPPIAPAPPHAPQLNCPGPGPSCELRDELCQGPNPPPAYATWYCRHRDPACPDGPFAPVPVGISAVYVDAGANGPGDGTLNDPYPDLATALLRSPGEPVWLAPGEYVPPPVLPAGLELIGACARPTLLRGELNVAGALTLQGLTISGPLRVEDAILRDVRVIVGSSNQETLLRVAGALTMEGVSLEGPAATGLELGPGGRAQVKDLVSTQLQTLAEIEGGSLEVEGWQHFGALGSGFVGVRGAELRARRLLLEGVDLHGLHFSASTASVSDAWIKTSGAPAIYLVDRATAHLTRVVLTTEAKGPIEARNSVLSGSDLQLENPGSEAPTVYAESSTLGLERVQIRCGLMGVLLRRSQNPPAPAWIADLDAERAAPCDPEAYGGLVYLEPDTSVQLERAHLKNSKFGVFVAEDGELHAKDLEIGRATARCQGDNGITVEAGGVLIAERVRLYNLDDHGVFSQNDGSRLRLEDLEIQGVDDTGGDTGAIALNLSGRQGLMPIDRAWIHGRFGPVLRLGASMNLEINDLRLEQQGFDAAVEFNLGTNATFTRFVIEGRGSPGLIADNNTSFTVHDGVIRGLEPGLQTPTEPDRARLEGLRIVDTPCAYEARDEATQCR
ncbi:MAG: hypothetical protein IPG45_17595 [Deltaproteobacteria bacterium]|nr:hypothetical protein [Deltaproteobacteria bacterium]